MKRSVVVRSILFVFVALLATSCLKTKHSIRIINNYPDDLGSVHIGPADYGTVVSNSTTSYIEVTEGKNEVTGSDLNTASIRLQGTISVSGNGIHKWSVTIANSGAMTIKEDK